MNLFKSIPVIAFFLGSTFTLPSQDPFFNGVHYTIDNGLPDNSVRALEKGFDGFVWAGTAEGLCRFDGVNFELFRHDPEDPKTIMDDRIWRLEADSHALWIGTEIGLSRLDLPTGHFSNYQLGENGKTDTIINDAYWGVRCIFRDRQGEIWVGTRGFGMARYIPEHDDFKLYRADVSILEDFMPQHISSYSVFTIQQDRFNDSLIWAGTSLGIFEVNKYTERVRWLRFLEDIPPEKRMALIFRHMYQHHDGLLYVGTWAQGMFVYDPANEAILPFECRNPLVQEFFSRQVVDIREKNENEIWVTTAYGIFAYHTGNKDLTFWKKNDEEIYNIEFVDAQTRVWSIPSKGFVVYDPLLQQFQTCSFSHLHDELFAFANNILQTGPDDPIVVLAREARSIFLYDLDTKSWAQTPIPEKYLGNDGRFQPLDVKAGPDGRIWIAIQAGLFSFNPHTGSFSDSLIVPDVENRLITMFEWDRKGRLWIGASHNHLWRLNPGTGDIHIFQKELEVEGISPYNPIPSHLFTDSKNNLWYKRTFGMGVYVDDRDTFINFVHQLHPEKCFDQIHNFQEDKLGRVWFTGIKGWIAFAESGHPELGMVKKFDLNKILGVRVRRVMGMAADSAGNMWCATEDYLVKIDVQTLQFTKYSFSYGLEDPRLSNINFLPSGLLAFGSQNNIILTNPDLLRLNHEMPEPYLARMDVREQPLQKGTGLGYLNALRLRPAENFFSVEFSSKGFTLGQQNTFRYRLKNFSDTWIDAKNRRYASFTNVPGGNYLFQLQAANNEGIWNETLYELPITIATPWWQMWWFILVVTIIVLIAAWQFSRYRTAQIRQEEQEKAEFEKKLMGMEMSALRAQMNPHFLFNCLNSIDNFIIKNKTREASEYLNNFARLIRLILQNSQSNYVGLKDELEALELYIQMESLRFRNQFQYNVKVSPEVDVNTIDIPPMLIQPFVENAIWHGIMHKDDPGQGKVEVLVSKRNGSLQFVVEDNGIGRERAATLKAGRSQKGRRSIGLKITQDRIKLINRIYNSNTSVKIIDLKDEEDNALGTRVEVEIPI